MTVKWMSICLTALSTLAMHVAFAAIARLCISNSILPSILPDMAIIVGALFAWILCGRWCKKWLGISASAPAFVFVNIGFLWGVFVFLVRHDVGPAMDVAFNTQCFVLTIGLWRMLLSDPGYVRDENISLRSSEPALFSVTTSDKPKADHFAGTDCRLFMRARFCRKCQAYINRFDHHCPAFGNCVGQQNHWLFIFLLIAFVSAEMCYSLCVISRFSSFNNFWEKQSQDSSFVPWIISTSLFAVIQVLWQVPFLFWHMYCIFLNITTDEWVNWEKYPEFQMEIPPEPGRPFRGRKFKNPYNKGILQNIVAFLKSKA